MENVPPGSSDPSPKSELMDRADRILRNHIAESSLANLHTAIYLLAQTSVNQGPQHSECRNLLATALLTRFSYTGQWKDVQIACMVHAVAMKVLSSESLGVPFLTELGLEVLQIDDNPDDIVALAGNILTDFHQSTNLSSLNTAICLYEEAISAQDSVGINKYRMMRQLTNAYLIRSHTTGEPEGVQKSISLVRQLYGFQPNQVSWLCAALLSEFRIENVMEAIGRIQETSKLDAHVWELAQIGAGFLQVFVQAGDELNLDRGISAVGAAAAQVTWGHDERGCILSNLGNGLLMRFVRRGKPEDLDNAIGLHREVLDLHPALHPDYPTFLDHLANVLCVRFQTRGDAGDLDEAIELHREALDLHPEPHPDRGNSIDNLANVLHKRFEIRGDAGDLDNAIKLHCEALDLRPEPHPDRGSSLNHLAAALHERFKARGDAGDLDKAIELHREALNLHPAPHPDNDRSLNNLANVLHERFKTRGDAGDLDKAIELHCEALDLRPAPHPDRSNSLNDLANGLHERFKARGDAGDLDKAITLHRGALDLRPAPHPDRSTSLNNLAAVLHTRFEKRGDTRDLDNAIELHRKALNLRPVLHPDRGRSLNNLAAALHERFQTRGDPGDLDKAIELHCEALDLCPAPHPDRGSSLNHLAQGLHERFEARGDVGDLDNAIKLHCEALDLHPAPHPVRSSSLNSLANVLHKRFETRGDARDLDKAIELHHETLDLHPAPHPDRGSYLNNLANGLHERFETRGDAGDLGKAIKLHREALDLHPEPHPDHGIFLNNLATVLHRQFQTTGDAGDLDKAIELHREALDLHPAPHPAHGNSLNNLANVLHQRFQTTGDAGDLDNAIRLRYEAELVFQPPHPYRGTVLRNLATQLIYKFNKSLDCNIMEDSIIVFRESSGYLPSPVSQRLKAATTWARHADKNNHDSALEAYETSVELLPQQAMLGLDIESRRKALRLELTIGLATDAAACASRLNKIGRAVEFLEAGRSVFWSQALQLHTSLDDLVAVHPELAERIRNISKELEVGSHRAVSSVRILPAVDKDHMMLDKDDVRYRELNAKWVKTLDEVRQQQGFERFLRPKLMNELKAAAINGPIIILNASRSSCTAFIVTLSRDVQSVNLENLTWDRAQILVDLLRALLSQNNIHLAQALTKIQGREGSTGIPIPEERLEGTIETLQDHTPNEVFGWLLGVLWVLIVQPVFHALELKKSDHPSRLWWCPTGPLTFLPIHAAGIYRPHETDCVSDYVVSSYTHTLTALLNPPSHTASPFKMVAMIQPTTANCSNLPATVEELARIKQQVPLQWLTSLGDATPATVDIALSHLQESSVMHFACHGTQDIQNPLEGGLLLTDGRLKVSELMRGKSQKNSMTLAFLSACETAKGDDTVPDEAMHLAATLLFAGFRGVVATMWTMADLDGPRIAETFYKHLFKGCDTNTDPPDLTKAAECLHNAVANLRAANVPFSRWVPFVHYGL